MLIYTLKICQKLRSKITNFFLSLHLVVGLLTISNLEAKYEVVFEGVEDAELLQLIESASQLHKLKETSPKTLIGLKKRAEADITNIIQVLHSQAYYDAKVDFSIEDEGEKVLVHINQGVIYPLVGFYIRYFNNDKEKKDCFLRDFISLDLLNIELGKPALPEVILSAEDTLLDQLNLRGYALSTIKKRDVFANQTDKNIIVWIAVDIGPLTYFGPTKIEGNERTKNSFFYRKLRWHQNEIYDPKKIEKTQEALELSGLFRSVNITHAEELTDGNLLPFEITVLEGKQRSIGFGLNYTTSLGPGITAEWEDRNVQKEGHKLSFRGDLWEKLQEGSLTYVIPDYFRQDQNLIWLIDYEHERTKSFIETSLALSARIERKINDQLRVSYGGMYKLLRSQHSDHNGTFDLIKVPLHLHWSNADSILEPTKGASLQLKATPSLQILSPQFFYSINSATGAYYQALTKDKKHIFAVKVMFGTIIGASKHEIPPPERFYAGSQDALRGYRYLTVGPLSRRDKPLGGRSLFIYSLEWRNRIGKDFGGVLFYEIGNVYTNYLPNFKKELLQSVGFGLRYYTPIGPIRLDVAFPLNRRHKHHHHHGHYFDHLVEAYFSIGQAF